jgi:hypothetical protein
MPILYDLERVDLNPFSWSSLIYVIDGVLEIFGCTGVSTSWKRERSDGFGMGRSHAARTYTAGKVTFEPLKLKLYSDTVEVIRNYYASKAPDGKSFTEPRLTHSVQYVESETFADKHYIFENVAWVTETTSHDEGPDPLMCEVEFKLLRASIIRSDGTQLTPWNSQQF